MSALNAGIRQDAAAYEQLRYRMLETGDDWTDPLSAYGALLTKRCQQKRAARKNGRKGGRPPTIPPEQHPSIVKRFKQLTATGCNQAQAATRVGAELRLGASTRTILRIVKQFATDY